MSILCVIWVRGLEKDGYFVIGTITSLLNIHGSGEGEKTSSTKVLGLKG